MSDKILFEEVEIQEAIFRTAKNINREYLDTIPIILVVLNGGFIFASHVIPKLTIDFELDFTRVKSYEEGKKTTKEPKFLKTWESIVEGRDILILEDIVDSGDTIKLIKHLLNFRNPKSIKVASLIKREGVNIELEYCYLTAPKGTFLYGYGLDDNKLKRNLRDIYIKS